jgi:hypothetical protein
MGNNRPFSILFALPILFGLIGAVIAQDPDNKEPKFTDQQMEFFESKVRPLLVKRCYECHGPDADEFSGGLSLASRKDILKGGDSGPAVVPKKPVDSLLIDSINYGDLYEMPPDSKMPDAEIAILTQWVEMGAPWPAHSDVAAERNGEFNLQQRIQQHWCWQSIATPEIPSVAHGDWPSQKLDYFILNQLEQNKLLPSEPADRRTLIRRAYFDLIGLPPTPEQINAFVNDPAPNAFETVVDELLASPHFGERWARHWMDLTRYAETCGHEYDYPLPHAHQYRDYLIRAFNADVPYDQFITEHIAGDLMTNARHNPTEKFNESVLGTGFWYLGEATHGPVDVKGDEAGRIDNQIDVMTKTFLGLTVACARCHDHKFDAISAQDYYALAGFLQSSRRQEVMMDVGGKIADAKPLAQQLTNEADQLVQSAMSSMRDTDVQSLVNYLYAAAGIYADDPATNQTQDIIYEGEQLKTIEASGGQFLNQTLNPVGEFKWSKNEQSWWRDANDGDTWKLELPVPVAGDYDVCFDLTKARDYAIVEIYVDDKRLGEPIDLFDSNLTKTGLISLGQHHLENGNRSLVIKIVGKNEKAIPYRMVGIDYVMLRPISPTDDKKATRRTVETESAKLNLDPATLQRWVDILKSPGVQQPNHPLYTIVQLTKNLGYSETLNVDANDLNKLRNELTTIEKHAEQRRENAVRFADFDQPIPAGWFYTGEAFDRSSTDGDAFDPVIDGSPIALSGTSHSGRFGGKFYGVLRSPTFEIQSNRIHYRLNCKNAQIRLIIDGFELDRYNPLLFNGVTVNHNSDGHYQWLTQSGDIGNYKGHRAYIEIIDHSDGFAAVDEIWFSDGDAPGDYPSEIATNSAELSSLKEICLATATQMVASVRRDDVNATDRYFSANALFQSNMPGDVDSIKQVHSRIAALEIPNPEFAVGMTDGTGENEFVFVRGNHKSLGQIAPRQLITALADDDAFDPEQMKGSGRLELAREIASADNPLTSRVAVNRVWHHLTGRGIVASVDNFGVLGTPPSHPELLDHMASDFANDGWSLKRLIRRIMLSSTYQMSSNTHPDNVEQVDTIDPANNLLHKARVRRLQGEAIRDSLLAISGRLDPKMYGPSVPIHLTQFMQGRGRPGKSGPLDGNGRRSIYLEVRRNFLSPMMLAFDTPIPFNAIGQRNVSNVPAQALIMMNNPLVIKMAERWAEQIVKDESDVNQRIDEIYQAALGRKPSDQEMQLAIAFLKQQSQEYGISDQQLKDDARPWSDLCHIVFNVKEFIYLK